MTRALAPLAIILATLWGLAWISMLDGNSTAAAAVIGIPVGAALFAAGAYAVLHLPAPFTESTRPPPNLRDSDDASTAHVDRERRTAMTTEKRMTWPLFQSIRSDAWKLFVDADSDLAGTLTEDEKALFEAAVIAGIRATCEALDIAAVPVMPT